MVAHAHDHRSVTDYFNDRFRWKQRAGTFYLFYFLK